MTLRPTLIPSLLAGLGVLSLALPGAGLAAETVTTTPAGPPSETVSPAPPSEAPAAATTTTPTPAPPASPAPEATATPQVQEHYAQGATPGAPAAENTGGNAGAGGQAGAPGESGSSLTGAGKHALAPSALTPSLPFALQSSLAGVPPFFIESFRVPPFLLAIFQAAGTAYGIPWQVLAAINEVETDYGRDLSVSSAGAEGWMQFLPSSWAQYGVDANGDGFKDPYNPADAIFAAARYLRAAGGDTDVRAAVFAYNHSQAYVESVMLRAQLLGGTPSELLGAITGITEARFPVHAAAHFSDGFPTVATGPSGQTTQLIGTSIYAQAGAPVIAVQDGQIVQIGESAALGRFVVLRDAFGNTYTYGRLGDVASLYPVLQPHPNSTVSRRIHAGPGTREAPPNGPATAGAQPRSPISESAAVSGLALGAAASLEAAPAAAVPVRPAPAAAAPTPTGVRVFRSGANDVFLQPLRAGVQVIAGTVLGHLGGGSSASEAGVGGPHVIFQIRPAGLGAPQIDPKPILDGWVALENTSIFGAKGENPFLATSPTVGQVLLESKQQLEPQVLHDGGIRLTRCGREDVQGGRVDKRVLAMLEYLSVSGLKPSVAGLKCAGAAATIAANASAGDSAEAVDITAINGVPIAGHQGPGSIADIAVRRLLTLQGAARPKRVVSELGYPGAGVAYASSRARNAIGVAFTASAGLARTAALAGTALTPAEWIRLISRLGEIPDPTVARAPSAAAIPDSSGLPSAPGEGGTGGNH
jgi:murein DD-endopeptidase MepM/ murein hydrolase activator NlpD